MPSWQTALIAASVGFVLGIILCGSVESAEIIQANCLPHHESTARLKAMHNETLVGRGLSRTGMWVEIFASPHGTWTIVATDRRGLSCVRAEGTFWQVIEPEPEGTDT